MIKTKIFILCFILFITCLVLINKDAKSGAEPACALDCYSKQTSCVLEAKNPGAKLQCMSEYADCLAGCPQEE